MGWRGRETYKGIAVFYTSKFAFTLLGFVQRGKKNKGLHVQTVELSQARSSVEVMDFAVWPRVFAPDLISVLVPRFVFSAYHF